MGIKGYRALARKATAVFTVLVCACALLGCSQTAASTSSSSSSSQSVINDKPVSGQTSSATLSSVAAESSSTTTASVSSSQAAVQALIDASGIDASVTYVDLATSAGYGIDGSESRAAASMIKLVVLAELLDEVAQGRHSLDEQVTVKASDVVGGTGIIQNQGAGTTLPLSTIATDMIAYSDNTAANIIIDMVGMGAVNAQAAKLGLTATSLQRKMLDTSATSRGIENHMSSDDAATILSLIYRGQLVNAEMGTFALSALQQQACNSGLPQGVPSGVIVAHKTGTLTGIENDGGIILAENPYVLVVMTDGGGSSAELQLITDISEAVYNDR